MTGAWWLPLAGKDLPFQALSAGKLDTPVHEVAEGALQEKVGRCPTTTEPEGAVKLITGAEPPPLLPSSWRTVTVTVLLLVCSPWRQVSV